MNKSDKIWVAVLVAALVAYMMWPSKPQPQEETTAVVQEEKAEVVPDQAKAPAEMTATPTADAAAATTATTTPVTEAAVTAPAVEVKPVEPPMPAEETFTLADGEVVLTLSSYGATVKSAELIGYKAENTDASPNFVLQTGDLLSTTFPGQAKKLVYTQVEKDANNKWIKLATTLPSGVVMTRTVTLEPDYVVSVKDEFASATAQTLPAYTLNAGTITLSADAGDVLGADALAQDEDEPEYYESELGKLLGAGSAFLGCGTSSDPTGVDVKRTVSMAGAQTWMALKNRFFVALTMPQTAANAELIIKRDETAKVLRINEVSANFNYPSVQVAPEAPTAVTTRLYVGPKKLSHLRAFGADADEVMDFGFFTWVCVLLLPLLNFFYWLIPNYGVAILLLTVFVRVVFWPLTHKSTIAMRKMAEIQPMIKELQQKYKDQPQKIQMETFKLYREYKVNPLSSCLPMLIQIPIFIALFVVLRSAVELRFASFLWISDLSQPENLFRDALGFSINILPILTAITMGMQTHLSPSAGDPSQKKMMTWMMPIMLLFMFYSMASALCLYWTASQILSILQVWLVHRKTKKEKALAKA